MSAEFHNVCQVLCMNDGKERREGRERSIENNFMSNIYQRLIHISKTTPSKIIPQINLENQSLFLKI